MTQFTPPLAQRPPQVKLERRPSPPREQKPQETLASVPQAENVPAFGRLIGKTYTGELRIARWKDFGGGLLGDGYWYQLYRRSNGGSQQSNGAYLMLVNREMPRRAGSDYATFLVTDAVLTAGYGNDITLSVDCEPVRRGGINRIIAAARIDRNAEWSSDVIEAWSIQSSGKAMKRSTTGVRCHNEMW